MMTQDTDLALVPLMASALLSHRSGAHLILEEIEREKVLE